MLQFNANIFGMKKKVERVKLEKIISKGENKNKFS